MEFVIEEVYEKADLTALARATLWRRQKSSKLNSLRRMLSMVWGVILVFGGIAEFVKFIWWIDHDVLSKSVASLWLGMVLLAAGVILVLLHCSSVSGHFAWKNYERKGMTLTYRFGEEDFSAHTSVSDGRCDYVIIEEVVEDKTHYFLFISASAAYMIRKDSFTKGDPEQFRSFIAEKVGKPIKQI